MGVAVTDKPTPTTGIIQKAIRHIDLDGYAGVEYTATIPSEWSRCAGYGVRLNVHGLRFRPCEIVRIDSARLGWSDKLFFVGDVAGSSAELWEGWTE